MAAPTGENEFDLFVSYAHADDRGGHVTALVERVREEHAHVTLRRLAVFFDRDAIHTMDDWEHRILAGLKASKVMLAVLSPDYFRSKYCRQEWKDFSDHEAARRLPGEAIAPIYVVTVRGFEDAEAAVDKWRADLRKRQYLDLRLWWDEGTAALEREEVRLKLQALEEQVAKRIDAAERVEASPSTVPEHNRNFVGRTEELRQLRRMLIDGRVGAIAAVHGVGGIGKSALAFEYAHAFAAEYPGGRFLVTVAGATDLRIPIINLAPQLGIELTDDDKKDLAAAFSRVRARLEQGEPSLLLLDNLDDSALLAPARRGECLPHGKNVHILVTTRIGPEQLPGLDCLALDRLSDEDGLRLLERYRPPENDDERAAALGIVRHLGGHALAVEVVAVYLAQNHGITFAGYLARLEKEGLGALDAAGGDPLVQLSGHPETLLGPLLEPTLAALTPAEIRVLEYACLLPPDRIALPWLSELTGKDFPEVTAEPEPGYANRWQRLVRRLDGLRLLIRGDDRRLARMHRIVQDVVRARMAAEEVDECRGQVTAHARQRAMFVVEGWVQRETRWEIAPLRDYAVRLMGAEDTNGALIGNDVTNAAIRAVGNLAEARGLMRWAITICEKVFPADDPKLATFYSTLATIERHLGDLDEARKHIRRTIRIRKKAFGADHPKLANSYSSLAMIERDLGHLDVARELMRRVIKAHERAFKADDPTLARDCYILATIERDLGNLGEAQQLMHRATEIDTEAFPADHPWLAICYFALATIERRRGRLNEARACIGQAITVAKKAFAADHWWGATFYCELAYIAADSGKSEEARQWMRQAHQIRRAKLGDGHPDTQSSRCWLEKNDPEFSGGD